MARFINTITGNTIPVTTGRSCAKVDDVFWVMRGLGIDRICEVSDSGEMILGNGSGNYRYQNLSNSIIFRVLRYLLCKSQYSINKILVKLNPSINLNLLCVRGIYIDDFGYYNRDDDLDFSDTKEFHGPCFVDGRDDRCTWTMTLPPNPTAETLAKIIEKHFIGIGGIIKVDGVERIFFTKDSYCNRENGCDYSHCVSHEINRDALSRFYYHPTTIGGYLKERRDNINMLRDYVYFSEELQEHLKIKDESPEWKEKYEELMEKEFERKDPYPVYTSNEGLFAMEKYHLKDILRRKELLSKYTLEEKNQERKNGYGKRGALWDILAWNNWKNDVSEEEIENARRCVEEYPGEKVGLRYLEEIGCGFQYMCNVPFDLQLKACAIVAGVTPEEMMVKLNKASGR